MSRRTRRMTMDLHPDDQHPPQPGDVIVTARTVHRVTGVREVDSRVWCNRWRLDLTRIGAARNHVPEPPVALAEGQRLIRTYAYRPGETPAEWFAQFGNSANSNGDTPSPSTRRASATNQGDTQ